MQIPTSARPVNKPPEVVALDVVGHEVVGMGAAGLGLSGWVVLNHPSDIESPAAMTHRNAPLTPQGRYRLVMRVQAGHPIAHVAAEVASSYHELLHVGGRLEPVQWFV